MNKIILNDQSEIDIREGCGLTDIMVDIADYAALAGLAARLTPENLKTVQFAMVDDGEEAATMVTDTYHDMVLREPHFTVTATDGGLLEVIFGIREKTPEEQQQADVATAIAYLSDEQAATVKDLYPEWRPAGTYKTGDRRRYEDKLYKCLQDHHAQPSWNPADAQSLWAEILTDPGGEVLPWIQPESTNGYSKGDKVTHKGQTWESDIDNNVWEPGAQGTESLWHVVE